MNTLLLTYTFQIVAILIIIGTMFYLGLIEKTLKGRDLSNMSIGALILIICLATIYTGKGISDKLSNTEKPQKEFYSMIGIQDSSKISDEKLYKYLLASRTKHAKIIFAQGKHESNAYTSPLYKRANNLFGMKISTQRATCGFEESGEYQKYSNWKLSVTDYIIYSLERGTDNLSDEEYLNFLGTGRYATDPKYKTKIEKMIKNTDFNKLAQ